MPTIGNRPRLWSLPGRCKEDEGEKAMNRAWIPAGALAGVSVAGLIALGPLTDSLGTKVSFSPSVAGVSQTHSNAGTKVVPVSLSVKEAVGDVRTAALNSSRGGESAVTATSGDDGLVGYRNSKVTAKPTTTRPVTPPKAKPKKTPKRQALIGTSGEQNGDTGLAGSDSGGNSSTGEVGSTPAP
jgi:hypothetical protein